MIDEVKKLVSIPDKWHEKELFRSILKGNFDSALSIEERAILDIVKEIHAGMTTEAYEQRVKEWIKTARHPKTGMLFTDMVYQPMLELLTLLREHQFDIYIASGGDEAFMRPWTERVYGIPTQNVIGSRFKAEYQVIDGEPSIVRLPIIDFIDDKKGKPVGIQQRIGKRPLAAFGNSDGDLQMLEWTTAGEGLRFGLIVHHTDGKREWAYDKYSLFGRLDKALKQAKPEGWTVVDMKKDWKVIYRTKPQD